jgi:hypothetical protein
VTLPTELDVSSFAQSGSNEMARLTLAISRLRTGMDLAIQRMKRKS